MAATKEQVDACEKQFEEGAETLRSVSHKHGMLFDQCLGKWSSACNERLQTSYARVKALRKKQHALREQCDALLRERRSSASDSPAIKSVSKATELRDQVVAAKRFIENPAAAILQKGLDSVAAPSTSEATTGSSALDNAHSRSRELLGIASPNEVSASVAKESSLRIQQRQAAMLDELDATTTGAELLSSGLSPIPMRGAWDSTDSGSLKIRESGSSTAAFDTGYVAPRYYQDPQTGAEFVIPAGFALYRPRAEAALQVVRVGTHPTADAASCSSDGVGIVTIECEMWRRGR